MNTKPNIVFILADDMGYGDFSAFNGGLSHTPTLDAFMTESVCLRQHYTASPVCNPSRAALLTGRYPHRTGSIDTLEWWGLERLALRETTLADLLKVAGYATGLVGKWHLGSYDPRYHPNQRGFDEAVCFRGGMHDYYNWRLEFNDRIVRADGRYLTDVFSDEAVNFIERHQDEPFFLHVTYNAPHSPYEAPWEEIVPFLEKGTFTRAVSILYAMIRRMDRGVARILETLQRLGLEGRTMVFFTSDNGPQFGGEGENCTTRFNCQFNGAKGTVYEGGIRAPLIVRWPEGLPGGRTVNEMVHFTDWLPTILSMAGVTLPETLKLDGINVLPLLRGETGQANTHRFWQWNRYTPLATCNAAMRDGDFKLIRPALDTAMQVPDIEWLWVSMYGPEYFIRNGAFQPPYPERDVPAPPSPELYNLAEDPLEQANVAQMYPGIVESMSAALDAWFAEVEAERKTIPRLT
jgi:arylsulfatase A